MNYRTLFEMYDEAVANHAPIARHSDPTTSHKAAAEIESKLNKCQERMLTVIRSSSEPMTSNEAAEKCWDIYGRATHETYRKRVKELLVKNKVEECGFRPCTVTGKNAQTFKARGK